MQEVKVRIEDDVFIADGELVADTANRLVAEGSTVEAPEAKVEVSPHGSIKFSVKAKINRAVAKVAEATAAPAEVADPAPEPPTS